MTKIKKLLVIGLVILSLSVVSLTTFAATENRNTAEAFSNVTGTTLEEALALRAETGKTYGKLAFEAGKALEFKAAVFEMKKNVLASKVESGELTQEEADEILTVLEARIAECDGTGFEGAKSGTGLGLGTMLKNSGNSGTRIGGQTQRGTGQRQGLRDGSRLGN